MLLVGKPVVDFLFVIIELFCYHLRLRRYKRKSVEVGFFRRGRATLSANFRRKRASPAKYCRCQKSTVISLSCGIKISVVRCLVLSQSTRVTDGQDRQTDRRTDEQTDGRTDRITTRQKSDGHKTPLSTLRRRVL